MKNVEKKGMSLREGKRESISERGMVKLSTTELKVTVQKVFQAGGRATETLSCGNTLEVCQ